MMTMTHSIAQQFAAFSFSTEKKLQPTRIGKLAAHTHMERNMFCLSRERKREREVFQHIRSLSLSLTNSLSAFIS